MKKSKPERQGWRERLKQNGYFHCDYCPKLTDPHPADNCPYTVQELEDFIAAELSAALDGLVPNDDSSQNCKCDCGHFKWTHCRSEVLRRIEERKRERGL